MGYACRIERHSITPLKRQLMTAVVTYPRKVLAEVRTHRTVDEWTSMIVTEQSFPEDMSKNAASSRAIPIEKMIAAIEQEPFIPERFGRRGKGMQEDGYLTGQEDQDARMEWLAARDDAVQHVRKMMDIGMAKQDANRILEPWAWTTQVLTGDDYAWCNFFALRTDSAADPAFRRMARMLALEWFDSKPTLLTQGQWHLPFVPLAEQMEFRFDPDPRTPYTTFPDLLKASIARCAWISYNAHDGEGSQEKIDRTFERLLLARPVHASPSEHQGTPMHPVWHAAFPNLRSNFTGWLQARKLVALERATTFEVDEATRKAWREELALS